MKRLFASILFLTFTSIYGNATDINKLKTDLQNAVIEKDRLEIIQKIAQFYLTNDLDSCELYVETAFSLASKLNSKKELADVFFIKGELLKKKASFIEADSFYNLSLNIFRYLPNMIDRYKVYRGLGGLKLLIPSYDEAEKYFNKCLQIASDIEDNEKKATSLINLGIVNSNRGEYELSFKRFYQAISFLEKSDNKNLLATAYNNLSLTYRSYSYNNQDINELPKAIMYQKKAIQIHKAENDIEGIIKGLANLGGYYGIKGDLDSSLVFSQEALEFAKAYNNVILEGKITSDIGNVYFVQGNFKEAIKYYKKGERILEERSGIDDIIARKMNIGMAMGKMGDYDASIKYQKEALVLVDSIKQGRMKEAVLKNLSLTYKDKGDYKNAFFLQKERQFLRDSLLNESRDKALLELETKYETEKKEQQITILNQEKEIETAKAQAATTQANNFKIITTLSLLFLSIVGYLLYRFIKLKNHVEDLREAQSHATTNSYARLLNVVEEHKEATQNKEAIAVFNKTESLIKASAVIHTTIEKIEQDKKNGMVNFSKGFHDLCNKLKAFMLHEKEVQVNITCDEDILIPNNSIQSLFLLIEELFTNASKHAFGQQANPQIDISLKKLNNTTLQLSYRDNGVGLPKTIDFNRSDVKGFEVIRSLVKKLKGTIYPEITEGLAFRFNFDYKSLSI